MSSAADDDDGFRAYGKAFLADVCERQQKRLTELERERDRERGRLVAWLRHIASRTSGMGADLARIALNSNTAPPTKGPNHAQRRQARSTRR